MYRENSKGLYNIPFGKHKNPLICDAENIANVSKALRKIEITCGSYEHALGGAKKGDFVYLDPPYEPLNSTSSFTQYQAGGFSRDDQKRVQEVFEDLNSRGCYVMVSNSTAPLIRDLYSKHVINKINVARSINASVAKRGKIEEMVITNYVPNIGKYAEKINLRSSTQVEVATGDKNLKYLGDSEMGILSGSSILLEA
jgi:DNA adenine methylase